MITHWLTNNQLRKDRHTPTNSINEFSQLGCNNGIYELSMDGCQVVANRLPDGCHSIDKDSIDKGSLEKKREEKNSKEEHQTSPKGTSINGPEPSSSLSDNDYINPNDSNELFMTITTIYNNISDDNIFNGSDSIKVLDDFFKAYRKHRGKDHQRVNIESIKQIIRKMPCDGDVFGSNDFLPEDYPLMIEAYFKTSLDCDYSIHHFFSGDIRDLRMLELSNGKCSSSEELEDD